MKTLSVKEVAAALGVNATKVGAFIKAGELAAIDTSLKQGSRPRYRILQTALEQFLERRAVVPKSKPAPRRRRQSMAEIPQYV